MALSPSKRKCTVNDIFTALALIRTKLFILSPQGIGGGIVAGIWGGIVAGLGAGIGGGIVAGLGLEEAGFESRHGQEITLFSKTSWSAVWSNQPPIQQNRNYFSGIKRPGREAYHSPPSSTEAVNEWSCTSPPPVCLRGVDRDHFTFFTAVCKYIPYSSRYKHQLFSQTPLIFWCLYGDRICEAGTNISCIM
jgi:hypothetical protein